MRRLRPSLLAAVLSLAALPAAAGTVVIANGLAPPNPANVIDGSNSFPLDSVAVANEGCDPGSEAGCPSPGGPTTVAIRDGGVVAQGMTVHQSSAVEVDGGDVPLGMGTTSFNLVSYDTASIVMRRGTVGGLVGAESSAITMLGGVVQFAEIFSTLHYFGGQIHSIVTLLGGVATIHGSGFAVDGEPVDLGAVEAAAGMLTGTLLSGEPLEIAFDRGVFVGTSGFLVLVPEPSTALLLASGLEGLAAARRRERAGVSSSSTP